MIIPWLLPKDILGNVGGHKLIKRVRLVEQSGCTKNWDSTSVKLYRMDKDITCMINFKVWRVFNHKGPWSSNTSLYVVCVCCVFPFLIQSNQSRYSDILCIRFSLHPLSIKTPRSLLISFSYFEAAKYCLLRFKYWLFTFLTRQTWLDSLHVPLRAPLIHRCILGGTVFCYWLFHLDIPNRPKRVIVRWLKVLSIFPLVYVSKSKQAVSSLSLWCVGVWFLHTKDIFIRCITNLQRFGCQETLPPASYLRRWFQYLAVALGGFRRLVVLLIFPLLKLPITYDSLLYCDVLLWLLSLLHTVYSWLCVVSTAVTRQAKHSFQFDNDCSQSI